MARPVIDRRSRAFSRTVPGKLAWPLVIFGLCFAVVGLFRFRTPGIDAFVTLVGGREIAKHGLPHTEHLTLLGSGRRWIDQQWLAQSILYRTWDIGGYRLMALLGAALVASAFAILARILLERGAAPRRMVKWTLLAFAVALPDIALRAQDFAYPLFVLLVWVLLRDLDADKASPRRLALAVGFLILWANIHGTVLLGSALVVAYCCWRAMVRDRLVYLTAAFAAAASIFCTPYGLDIIRYYTPFLGNSAIRRFSSEWQPATHFYGLPAIPFFLLVGALLYVLARYGVSSRPLLVAVTALVGLGFAGFRWQCWAAIVAVVLATDVLNAARPPSAAERAKEPRLFEIGLGLLAVPALVALLVQTTAGFEGNIPRDAIAAVARYPAATVLADDVTATPLLWLQPRFAGRLAIDDRLEVFTPKQVDYWADYVDGKAVAVARLSPSYDVLVASHDHAKLVKRLLALPGRRLIYDGKDGVVLVSTGDSPRGWSKYP